MTPTNNILGIACIISGMFAISVMDMLVKWLSSGYPLHEIVLIRTLVGLVFISMMVHYEVGLSALASKRIGLHAVRGLLIATANMTFYLALAVLPLAEATAIFLTAPLIIVALSGPICGETVGWRRWTAVIIGFGGVLLVSGVGSAAFQPAALLPLVGAVAYALTQLMTRRLGITESASVMAFYIAIVFVFVSVGFWLVAGDGRFANDADGSLTFLLRAWHWPQPSDWMLMAACGVLVAIFSYFLSQAYRISEANIIAPFEYVSLPLSVMWGYLVWHDVLTLPKILGMVLIAGAGIFVFIHERRKQARMRESVLTA